MDNQPIKVNMGNNLRNRQDGGRFGRSGPIGGNTSRPTGASFPAKNDQALSGKGKSKDNKLMIRMFDRLVGLSIFMIFFGIPLYFTGLSFQGIGFEKQIYFYLWLLLGLVIWVIKGVILGEMRIKRTLLDIPILGFWLMVGISTIFSVDRWHSFWGSFSDPSMGFMNVTALVIAYYFIMSNFNEKRLRLVLTALVSSGAILIAWTTMAIFQIKVFPDAVAKYLPASLMGDFASVGVMLAFLVLIFATAVLKVADSGLSKVKKNVLLGALLLFLAEDLFLIMPFSNQIPWLVFFVGVALFLIYILARIVRPKANWFWFPMFIFIAVMILRMIGPVSISKISLLGGASLDYKTSLEIAKNSLAKDFLVGSGPATYGYDFSLYRPQNYNETALSNLRFYRGSGLILESISTVGALGAFFLIVLALTFIGTMAYFTNTQKEGKNKLYSLGFFSASSILVLATLFSRVSGPIVELTALVGTFSLAVVLWESGASEKYLNLSLKSSPKYALALAFVFMVVSTGVAFLFVFLGKVYLADAYAGRAANKISSDSEQGLAYLGKSINLNPRESRYFVQGSQYYMALANEEASKDENSRDTVKIQNYLNASIAFAKKSVEMSPKDVSIAESLALIYENAGFYVVDSLDLASQTYKKAQELEPHNPTYYVKLGQIDVSQAVRKDKAEDKKPLLENANEMFDKATQENKNYADAFYQSALVYEALDDLDKAISQGEKASSLNPYTTTYILFLGRVYQKRGQDGDMDMAQKYYQRIVALNDKDVVGHFYLGLFWEKNDKPQDAKKEYQKVLSLFEEAGKNGGQKNQETMDKVKQMIANVDKGIANTPESLGLVDNSQKAQAEPSSQPANPSTTPPVIAPENSEASAPASNSTTPGPEAVPAGPNPATEPVEQTNPTP